MSERLNKLFKAVADPTRREIFNVLVLAGTALSLTQISSHFDISRQGITKHVDLLVDAGLVQIHTQGRERYCMADPKPLKGIVDWIAHYDKFWDKSLTNLGDFLDGKS
jgi:DNA-binding transcriptional ArsR family regulator